MEGFYLDTSIWLDFYEQRGVNGEEVMKLITKIIQKNYLLAYSDLHIKEFKNLSYSHQEIIAILAIVKKDKLRHIHIHGGQIKEALSLARQRKIPKKDALHAILCRDNNLQLIARDPHFEKLKDISLYKIPESVT
ncbi:MAG TPA: PIN domain-containing protein [Candidatus Nanoarchaeia archaeon]|nr:PIN domain-containing protein [Candidatus Nanoarchaeia archaeon]